MRWINLKLGTALMASSTVLLLAGGCVYSSSIERQVPQPPKAFGKAKTNMEAPPVGRWWRLFKDPRLDRLMSDAFAENLDLKQAWARLESARASVTLARAGYWPRVSIQGRAGRSQTTMQLGKMGDVDVSRNTLELSLGASYEIDLWGRVRYAVKAARFELEATEADLQAAYISLAAQLAESYFLAVELRSQLSLIDGTIENRGRQVDLVQRRYAEGVVTALDLYQAQGSLATARARRADLTRRLDTTEHAIAVILGRAPGQRRLAGSLDALPSAVVKLPTGVPGQLLLRRPDLQAVHQRLMAADASVGAAVAAHYPTLSLSASAGFIFDPVALVWNVLGSLTAPLFEGNRVSAEVKLKRAQLDLALNAYRSTLLQALREVEDALVNGQGQAERVRHLEASVAAAEGALRLSTEQYAQGLISFLPVLTAEQSVYTARSELIAARRELISARIQLARALGGGWMKQDIERRKKEGQRTGQSSNKSHTQSHTQKQS